MNICLEGSMAEFDREVAGKATSVPEKMSHLYHGIQHSIIWLIWCIHALLLHIYKLLFQNGAPFQTLKRFAGFRPPPGRIWSSFLLQISRSSCVDHPCKISANLVTVKALKIDLVYRRSEFVRNWHTTGKHKFESLNDHQIGWNLQGWSTHDDEDISRRKLDRIRPGSGRKSHIRTGKKIRTYPDLKQVVYIYIYIYIYIQSLSQVNLRSEVTEWSLVFDPLLDCIFTSPPFRC